MKRKTKQTVAIICTLILTAGLSSSALATPIFGDINSQNRISFAGLDNEPGNEDDVLFDAGDFETIENLVSNNIEIMNENIVAKGGTLDGDMIENINSIPNILGTEYITAQDIQYTYHHHTINANSNDSQSSTGGTYADGYVSSTKTGCYQTPKYHQHNNSCICNGNITISNGGEGDGAYAELWCSRCGQCLDRANQYENVTNFWNWWGRAGEVVGTHSYAYYCNKAGTIEGYTCGCGKRDGQIVAADIIYSND
ncbi:MAG: hypothetical protein J5525_12625 [Lachnospiraceae bacterium]|nr:hypothetical protein [Lachnospiraceae bacterium]